MGIPLRCYEMLSCLECLPLPLLLFAVHLPFQGFTWEKPLPCCEQPYGEAWSVGGREPTLQPIA